MTQSASVMEGSSPNTTARAAGAAPTVLVIDDSNLCREMVAGALRGNGYSTLSASDGEIGLSQLQTHRVDAVILDNEMPKMTGLAFLRAVRADQRWGTLPIVMLTTNVSKEVITEALSHKVSGYLLKGKFSMTEMLARVRGAVAQQRAAAVAASAPTPKPKPVKPANSVKPAPTTPPSHAPAPATVKVPNLVARDVTLAAMAEFKSAKTLPGVVAQIASIAGSGHSSAAEMAAVIRQDPILAARAVHLAMSNVPAGQKLRLVSIEDAVRAVGVDGVRDLAASVGAIKEYPKGHAAGAGILICWQRALAVATVMTRTIPKTDSVPNGLPCLIGLLSELAEMFLRQRYPTEFAAVIDFAAQMHVPITGVIASVFGASHGDITDALLQHLKLPAVAADPIKEYWLNAGKPVEAHKTLLARCLAISDFIVNGMLFASSNEALVAPVAQIDCRTILIPTTGINFPEIRSETTTSICMQAKVDSAAEASLMKPMFARHQANVWYMRHSHFAALDPIEAAISSMANPKTHERLPHPNEITGLQALVVLSPGQNMPMGELRRLLASSPNMPTLLITAPSEPHHEFDPGSSVEQVSYPVSLKRLAEFFAKLK